VQYIVWTLYHFVPQFYWTSVDLLWTFRTLMTQLSALILHFQVLTCPELVTSGRILSIDDHFPAESDWPLCFLWYPAI
jgi:hypothetical protein